MISILISLLIALVIFALLWYVLSILPLPAPIANIVRIVFCVIVAIWLIYMLLPYAGGFGHPFYR